MCSNPLLLREKLRVVKFPSSCRSLCQGGGGGVYGEIVSRPLLPVLMWVFPLFAKCVGVPPLVWGSF